MSNDIEDDPEVKNVRHNGAKDRFVLVSGGMDSVAMAHYLIENEWSKDYGAWKKRPVVIYLDTGIGLSSQRIYVELLCDHYGWSLWKLRTNENFEELTEEQGFYGPRSHNKIFNRLKGRQFDKLSTISANAHFYTGIRWDESPARSESVREEYDDKMGAWFHNPILEWSDEEVVEYLRENEVPFNPNWDSPHFTDCGCGATASREELIELEAEGYEIMARKLRELEERTEKDDKTGVWAWGSFEDDAVEWLDDSDNEVAPARFLCSGNCSSKSRALDTERLTNRAPEGNPGGSEEGGSDE